VPAVVSASSDTGLQLRTLVLRQEGGRVSYSLQRGASPSLGDPDLTPVLSAQHALSTAVAALIAPNGGEAVDQGQQLAQFGIGFVLMPAPVDQGLARLLDGVRGLRPVSATSAFYLWRDTDLSARVRVVEPSGTVVAMPSGPTGVSGARVPAAGGTLELAEPAGGWNATLSGQPLTPVTSPAGSWAQAFRLPPGGGVLAVGRHQIGRDLILVLELLAAAAVAVLALPGSRAAAEEESAHAVGTRAAGSRAAGGARAAGSARAAGRSRSPARSEATDGYAAAAGPPQPREAPDAEGADLPGRRRTRGPVGRAAQAGRASRGQRRDRDAVPGSRRGRRPVPEELGPEELGAGPADGRRPSAGRRLAGGPAGPDAAWPGGQPSPPSGPHAEWPTGQPGAPSGPHAAWPAGQPGGGPAGPGEAWPGDQSVAGPPGPAIGAPRSPSGSWPPPDEPQLWASGQQGGWPAPEQSSGWPSERSDVLDPLPPAGGRHGRPAPEDDDEAPGAPWPVPEHESGGDAW
jgi:Arc/MetJ family transcription regulator